MYIVHCRVIVDNKCEFQHSSSHVNCTFDARTREQNAEIPFNKETENARLPNGSCLNNSKRPCLVNCISTNPECRNDHHRLVYNRSLVMIPQITVLCHRAFNCSSKNLAEVGVILCSQNFALNLATVFLLFFSLFSRQDPFIVRSAKLVHRSMISLNFVHPTPCSRPTLTIVYVCAATPSPAPTPARRCHLVVECGFHGQ